MATFRCIAAIALLAGAASVDVTPIEKVITLLEGMKEEVEKDGKSEAKAYDDFACFCKTTTGEKSESVKSGADKISELSADIADKTQEKKEDSTELLQRKQQQEKNKKDLEDTKVRCAKQKAEYEAEAADMNKAIQGLKDAIKAMKDSKPSLLSIRQTLVKPFAMAEAMGLLKAPQHKAVAAFIQQGSSVDPSDPEYKFHSNDIVEVCENLLTDYKSSKKDLDDEWSKTKKGCEEMKASLRKKIQANEDAMDALDKSIAKLSKEIAEHREDLVTAQSVLKDDELYLKDLTARCEDRAQDYDQRSAMRNDEVTALTQALEVLKGTVSKKDSVNVRALFVQSAKLVSATPKVAIDSAKASIKKVSLVQELTSNTVARGFLGLSQDAQKEKALDVLRREGQRLGSLALTSLAERAAADPFKKVKGLIQKLIERLLAESAAEATKKGFCDTELGKARKDRDFRFQEAKDLSAELAGLEAKEDALEEEIKQLKSEIKEETKALKETTKERKEEKEANMESLKTAKEGLDAVNEAILILKSFYKQAAKASFVQASPVDEDTSGPGFSSNYKGKQGSAKAVFALLETIASDFDRTLRKTEEAEDKAHREFVDFSQASESSIAGKTTKQELDEQDLETTKISIKTKTDDMQTSVDLLDKALQELEELKPTCIDTGMSYKERVKKREEEIEALQKALTILAPP
jgi:peptidoglycan hydrolase CwlO-like protein